MISEHQEQVAIFEWVKLNLRKYPQLDLLFAIPNGSQRSKRTGAMLKREGVRAGIPDLMMAYPNGEYHGLFIELKRRDGGKTSKAQKQWINQLNNAGYLAKVCHGAKEAVIVLEEYLK